ncbi:phosphatidylinositol N-acetylglucosaminyltransferase subunit P isoform X2 [Cajanus cajan]|uniref:phosphatidylinositol N-acetylglucosaminyltransferase subunit P isoform X2 n=1 Tax=Cajanus cajan TaxID=3821 RepID=UPI00098D87ED|nr:phosphatidylinositol N-acetylglucosaminyltransferase subunit P isoform X2 [Cajanus cajan]
MNKRLFFISPPVNPHLVKGCDMESPRSVNSPRRTLSLSGQRRATVSFFDPDDKTSGFGLSGDHGPKPSEVYGFVGSITTVVATESWLQSVGISYYPSRYWALAVPTYVMVTIVLMLGFYIGLNFISTPSPASLNTVFDEFSRDPSSLERSLTDEKPIEPISDIGIDRINDIMFNNAT